MIVVIDVCGVVEILLQKDKALKYYQILKEASLRITPDLYVSELSNTLWKYHNAKIRTENECNELIQDGIDFINRFIDSKELWKEALDEGIKNNHSIYDMFYMVAARRNNAVLVTNDSDLAAICKKNRIEYCF